MTLKLRLAVMTFIPLSFLQAAETFTWNTDENSLTYSDSVVNLSSAGATLSFSKFNADMAAEKESQAGAYTLSRVVIAIDGAIAGTMRFQNYGEAAIVTSANLINAPGLNFSVNGQTATETFSYSDPAAPFSVDASSIVNHDFQSEGMGLAQVDILTSLESFIGADTINATVSRNFGIYALTGEDIASSLRNLSASADVSVTYYYTDVPEPTSLALLGLGCAALLARRRFKRPSVC